MCVCENLVLFIILIYKVFLFRIKKDITIQSLQSTR